jgi:hypothetical protein
MVLLDVLGKQSLGDLLGVSEIREMADASHLASQFVAVCQVPREGLVGVDDDKVRPARGPANLGGFANVRFAGFRHGRRRRRRRRRR